MSMFKGRVEIENLATVRMQIDLMRLGTSEGLLTGLKAAGFVVEEGSKRAITQEPWKAIDTGRLRNSIGVSQRGFTVTVQPNTDYAIYVHEGTRYMKPRRFMQAGWGFSRDEVEEVIDFHIRKAMGL